MADTDSWLPRRLTERVREAMADTPVVCLLGPRQSGKTTLVRRAFPKRAYFSLDDDALQRVAAADPAGFIEGLPEEVTLDEVQRAPEVLRAIKVAVDANRRPGRFLLTGSANLMLLPSVSESLAGRIEFVHLQPLTEAELEGAPGGLLAAFIGGKLRPSIRPAKGEGQELVARVLRGGYPSVQARSAQRVRQWHRDYLAALVEKDAKDAANLRNLDYLAKLLALLSTRTAQLLEIEGVARQLGIRRETVQNNLAALERLFLVRRLPAWHRNESRRLVKAPKIHVVDSGIGASLARLDAEDWTANRGKLGPLIESFAVQQIVAQAAWTDPEADFWYYRDRDQFEVDLVMTRGRKTWGIEVKAGGSVAAADAAGLRRLSEQCGKDFAGGMVLYTGSHVLPMEDERIFMVPFSRLWTV